MSWSISHEADKGFIFSHFFEEDFSDFQIAIFIISSDIVDASSFRLGEDFPYGIAMIFHKKPVSDI